MAIYTEKTEPGKSSSHKMNGWLALSPLFVFLAVYLAGSLVARDFYKVPVAAAFIVLTGSYFVMKHVFYAQGVVSIIIELVGGGVFLLVLLRKGRL